MRLNTLKTPPGGNPACAINGICGAAASATSQEDSFGEEIDEEDEPLDPNPRVVVTGPEKMTIDQGTTFSKCPANAPINMMCDRGAEAWDAADGILTSRIELCSTEEKRIRFRCT